MTATTGSPDDEGEALTRRDVDDLMARNASRFHAYAGKRMHAAVAERESASDIVQSALYEVMKRRDALVFQHPNALLAYVYEAIGNKILERRRFWSRERRDIGRERSAKNSKDTRVEPADSAALSPSQQIARVDEHEQLLRLLDELDVIDRQIVIMVKTLDKTLNEVAEHLQMPESTVRFRLRRSIAHLAQRMTHGSDLSS